MLLRIKKLITLMGASLGTGGGGGGTPDNTTEGNVPVKQSGAFENSALREEATQMVSTKTMVFPASSVQIGPTQKQSDIGSAIGITDIARDTLSTIITSGTTGVTEDDRPTWPNAEPPEVLPVQPNDSENFVGKALSWTVTALLPDFTRTTGVTARGGSATTNLRVVIKLDDEFGAVVFKSHDDTLWEGGAGFTLNAAGDSFFDFESGFASIVGETYFITWEVPASAPDVTIKGFDAGEFVPYQVAALQRGVLEQLGDMLKSVYDTSDIGIVDGAQKVQDFAVLDEPAVQGDLLYLVDAPLSPEGFPTMGVADSDNPLKRPAVAAATEEGIAAATIKVTQNGFVSGVDTTRFLVNQEVFLSRAGKITAKTKKFRQEVGIVKDIGTFGSILFKQGDVIDLGKLLGYARDSGGISVYTSGPQFSGAMRRQVFQEIGPNQPQSMVTTEVHVNEVQQPVKVADTANPSFTLTPTLNNNILGFTLEAATTITNAIMEVFAGPTLIWQNNIGTLVADVETSFSFTDPDDQRPPIDLFAGVPYTVSFSSDDGDVVLKGTVGGDPFYALTWDDFVFEDLVTLPLLDTSSNTLTHGGVIAENSPTTIDISTGAGRIVTFDGLGKPTFTTIVWDNQINVPILDILTTGVTRVGFDINSDVVQIPFDLTPETVRNFVSIGFIVHPDNIIAGISNDALKSQTLYSQLVDHLEVLGVTRKSGLAVTPYAGVAVAKSAGILESPGAGVGSGNPGQNIQEITADPTGATFARVLVSTGDVETSATVDLDPGFFDNGSGTKVALSQPNNASIVYFYQTIEDLPNGLIAAYGQREYTSLQDAEINADTDVMVLPEAIEKRTNLIARVAMTRDATNLSLPGEATFLPGVKFGVSLTGGSAAAGGGGGDVNGPASAQVNEVATNADTSGKVLLAASDVSLLAGVMRRLSANQSLRIERNGNGVVQLGAGAILGNFGAVTQTGNVTFSISTNDPVGSPLLSFEQNSNVKGIMGFVNSENIFGMTTADGGGVFVEGGRTFIGIIPDTIPAGVACKIGSSGINTMMVPEIGNIIENALTGAQAMFHFNTTRSALRYHNGTEFRTVASTVANAIFESGGNNANTDIPSANLYVQMNHDGTLALSKATDWIVSPADNNKMRYDGDGTWTGVVRTSFEVRNPSLTLTRDYDMRPFINGVASGQFWSLSAVAPNATDSRPISFDTFVTISPGQDFDIRIKIKSGGTGSSAGARIFDATYTFMEME